MTLAGACGPATQATATVGVAIATPSPSASASSPATPDANASALPSPPPTAIATPTVVFPVGTEAWIDPCRQGMPETIESTPPAADDVAPVIVLGDATTGAMLAAAPIPDDPSELLLGMCVWQADAAGHQPGINAGTVGTVPSPGVSLQRVLVTQASPRVHALGGRLTDEVAAVEVILADGSTVPAATSGGYWLAWWTGKTGSTAIVGRDATGAQVSSQPFDDLAP